MPGRADAGAGGADRGRLRRRRRRRRDGGGGDSESEALHEGRQGRGRGEPDRLGRLRGGRLHRPGGRLGDATSRRRPAARSTSKIGNTSDEMVTLMRTGKYDGVSASGDASLRLVAGGDVDPVNVDLVPNYKDVFPALKDQPHNTVDGVNYGIPHGRGANLLMFNKDVVKPAPDSWGVVFDASPEREVQGQGHGLRQPDLHRGRGAVPEGDAARPRDRQRLRARRQAVRRRGGPAEAAARGDRRVLVRLHEGAGGLHVGRLGRRAPPGR